MGMKTYKGFNKDMTCRGFQYEEGKEYQTDKVDICNSGFHACEYPLDCFNYYSPNESVYHEVEQDGDLSKANDDTKVASTHIKIGGRLNISGLVQAAIDFTMSRIKPEAKSNEDYGASSATGYKGASSATGDYGASSATGDYGASSATGNCGASSATGYKGASSATGDYGASSATGNCGASSATGYKSKADAGDPESIAVAWGYRSKAKGVKGSYIVLTEWEGDDDYYYKQEEWHLKMVKLVHIDGEKYKADTYYMLIDGKVVEAEGK